VCRSTPRSKGELPRLSHLSTCENGWRGDPCAAPSEGVTDHSGCCGCLAVQVVEPARHVWAESAYPVKQFVAPDAVRLVAESDRHSQFELGTQHFRMCVSQGRQLTAVGVVQAFDGLGELPELEVGHSPADSAQARPRSRPFQERARSALRFWWMTSTPPLGRTAGIHAAINDTRTRRRWTRGNGSPVRLRGAAPAVVDRLRLPLSSRGSARGEPRPTALRSALPASCRSDAVPDSPGVVIYGFALGT
jgi:hypothetical protein